MEKLKIKPGDYLVMAVIVFAGLFGFWNNLSAEGSATKYAVIYVENEKVAELSLPPGESYEFSFTFGDNNQHTGTVIVDDGRIRMEALPVEISPRLIHYYTGWIEHSYQSIVCLPNRIMVVFRETDPGQGELMVDGVTY